MILNTPMFALFTFAAIFLVVALPGSAQAVIPPDFIFNVGMQAVQLFSITAILFTASLGALSQYIRTKYSAFRFHWLAFALGFIFIIVFCLLLSYWYGVYAQKVAFQSWVEESLRHASTAEVHSQEDLNSQLRIGSIENIDTTGSTSTLITNIDIIDDSARFIMRYFEYISQGDFERAYQMTEQGVSYDAFRERFRFITKISLDKVKRIDERKTSVELTLYTSTSFTRYGALLTLAVQDMMPVHIERSEVKVLSQGSIENSAASIDEIAMADEYQYFTEHQNDRIFITNEEFMRATEGIEEGYVVLDAREDIEYINGHFPEGIHIRFADLKAGRWIELPNDTKIYVLCWSGIRGKEVAEFLRTKNIVASYLEHGASGWVEFGGRWSGSINFADQYSSSRYKEVLSTEEVERKIASGAVLVDSREPFKFQQFHIPGSVNIPIMYTPTLEIETAFGQVPPVSEVIVVCDGYVNCFDAKVTGVELERRGHQFLGRYVTPWTYGK